MTAGGWWYLGHKCWPCQYYGVDWSYIENIRQTNLQPKRKQTNTKYIVLLAKICCVTGVTEQRPFTVRVKGWPTKNIIKKRYDWPIVPL